VGEVRIGVDLGGTKLEAIALDEKGAELARRRVATPAGNYDVTVRAIAGIVEGIERELGGRGTVGVGMPGAISPATGLVKNANSVWLMGQRFDRDLTEALGRPVRVANDANCFAVSEAADGAAAGAAVVFGVILGTGVGGGVAIHGRALYGANAIAGEWGHNPLPWPREEERPGRPCYCGKTACVETFLSGPGLMATMRPPRAGRSNPKRSSAARRRETGPRRRCWAGTKTAWRVGSPRWSTYSIRT
jgi:fructokinase